MHEDDGRLVAYCGAPFDRGALEQAAGPLGDWSEDEVPADWRARRIGKGVMIGRRSASARRSTASRRTAVIDVVVERRGSAFGSGSHPTTQMCVALMLELTPSGGAADLGCGVGTLAIVAAKLGWAPVAGVDRVPVAIEVARENVARNGVDVELRGRRPRRPTRSRSRALLLVNAPPPVHERVATSSTTASAT